jgi:cytochrome c oxidase assembly protein subunit 15
MTGLYNVWLHRFTRFLAVMTFLLIIVGGLVTSNDYGLAVPDWPKSYGMWMPPMIGGVLYEHGHRMVASFVGFLTVILTIWLWIKEPRKWVRILGSIALLAVITQGVLGGLTVLFLLPTPISVMHATLAQTFFCIVASLVLFTSKEGIDPIRPPDQFENHSAMPQLFAFTTISIYLQLILGAWMRHSKAALAIPDFPLAFGRVIPVFSTPEIAIHFAHRVNALIVLAMITTTWVSVFRFFRSQPKLMRPATLLFGLVLVQIVLGAFTVWTATAVPVATAHVAVGALVLATSLVLTLRGYRYRSVLRSSARAPQGVQLGVASA